MTDPRRQDAGAVNPASMQNSLRPSRARRLLPRRSAFTGAAFRFPPAPHFLMSSSTNPQEWLVHQCQACGSPMKIRHALAAGGSRIQCPVCQSPVSLETGAGGEEEFRAELPPAARSPEAARRREELFSRRDEEFSGRTGRDPQPIPSRPAPQAPVREEAESAPLAEDGFLRGLKHTSEYESRRKVRVKKKRKAGMLRQEEVGDWNTSRGEIPEARVGEDPWLKPLPLPEEAVAEHEAEFVVSEARDEGGVMRRVKRVKRRKLLTLGRLFFRRLSVTMRFVILGLAAALAGWGLWVGWEVIHRKWVALFYPGSADQGRPAQIFLTSHDEQDAMDVLTEYLKARTIEEKLRWVRLPERVKPLMEEWYRNNPDPPLTVSEITDREKIRAGNEETGILYLVQLYLEVNEPDPLTPGQTRKSRRWFNIEEIGSGQKRTYLVDWETSVGYQPMSWEQFRTRRPLQPVAFRVHMSLGGDYYNHEFTDEQRWQYARLSIPHPLEGMVFLFHGYIEAQSQAWRDLQHCDGSLILRLRYPQDSISADQVIVEGLEHSSWFYKETGAKKAANPQ
jgi:hypothetical protein